MMNREHFFEDYDEASARLARARYDDFDRMLLEWFDLLDDAPEPFAGEYARLKEIAPWEEVETSIVVNGQGMVGSGQLNWPRDRERRLSAQLNLFGYIANGETEAWQFFHDFFYSNSSRIDDSLHEMTDNLFVPFTRDLRRHLERSVQNDRTDADDYRTVDLDQETASYRSTVASLKEVEAAVAGLNHLTVKERERIAAEIRAGQELLKSTSVRIKALRTLLVDTLRWIVFKFADTAAGAAAGAALTYVLTLIGVV